MCQILNGCYPENILYLAECCPFILQNISYLSLILEIIVNLSNRKVMFSSFILENIYYLLSYRWQTGRVWSRLCHGLSVKMKCPGSPSIRNTSFASSGSSRRLLSSQDTVWSWSSMETSLICSDHPTIGNFLRNCKLIKAKPQKIKIIGKECQFLT